MRRSTLCILLSLSLSVAIAAPALAGEKVEGNGYSLRVPPGFTEAMSMEGNGNMRITSRCGSLPIDGMPEIKAFLAGGGMSPDGMIMTARVNLSRSITSAGELGLDQLERMKSQLPEGVDIRATKVDGRDAIEIIAHQETFEAERTSRVLSIAAGDYVVVVMMDTSDEAYADSSAMWSQMVASIKVEPGINKFLLFGLVGAAGMIGLWFLGRVKSRPARDDVVAYTGRFRSENSDTGPGFPPREGAEIGRRPKVLPSRPAMSEAPMPGTLGTPAGPPPSNFASDGAAAPVRTPSSPAVTRPAHTPAPAKPGLRSTLPDSGRWGE